MNFLSIKKLLTLLKKFIIDLLMFIRDLLEFLAHLDNVFKILFSWINESKYYCMLLELGSMILIPVIIILNPMLLRSQFNATSSNAKETLLIQISPPDCHAMIVDKVDRLKQKGMNSSIAYFVCYWEFRSVILSTFMHSLQNLFKKNGCQHKARHDNNVICELNTVTPVSSGFTVIELRPLRDKLSRLKLIPKKITTKLNT